MAEVVLCLHNVTELSVEYCQKPSPRDMVPLFTAAWNTFGSRLEKLTLTIDNLRTIFPACMSSKCLKELRIEFTPGDYPEDDEKLAVVLAPFINQNAASLRVLSLASSDRLWDMGPLLCSFAQFPIIQQFNVLVDLHKCGLSEPRGLTRILEDHSETLTSARLRPIVIQDTHWETAETSLVEWMRSNVNNKKISKHVESLDLRMSIAPTHLDLTVSYLRRSVETLTTLSLLDHNLRHD